MPWSDLHIRIKSTLGGWTWIVLSFELRNSAPCPLCIKLMEVLRHLLVASRELHHLCFLVTKHQPCIDLARIPTFVSFICVCYFFHSPDDHHVYWHIALVNYAYSIVEETDPSPTDWHCTYQYTNIAYLPLVCSACTSSTLFARKVLFK